MNQKPVDGVYSGIYEFISLQNLENKQILVVRKLSDTIALLNPLSAKEHFLQGDLIRLKWQSDKHQALSTKLYRKGKLSELVRKGFPPIKMQYNTVRIKPEGRHLLLNTAKYYLANTADANIRHAIDKNSDPVSAVISDKLINGIYAYQVMFSIRHGQDLFVKTVYYHPRSIYNLIELSLP